MKKLGLGGYVKKEARAAAKMACRSGMGNIPHRRTQRCGSPDVPGTGCINDALPKYMLAIYNYHAAQLT